MASPSLFSLADPVVYLVTAGTGAERNGLIATWVTQATLASKQPRALAVISSDCRTGSLIEDTGRFTLQLLEESQLDLVGRFGLGTREGVDKWEGLETAPSPAGLPLVAGTCGWADCRVAHTLDTGDRFIYVADVETQHIELGRSPMRESLALGRQSEEVARALERSYELDIARDDGLLAEPAGPVDPRDLRFRTPDRK